MIKSHRVAIVYIFDTTLVGSVSAIVLRRGLSVIELYEGPRIARRRKLRENVLSKGVLREVRGYIVIRNRPDLGCIKWTVGKSIGVNGRLIVDSADAWSGKSCGIA